MDKIQLATTILNNLVEEFTNRGICLDMPDSEEKEYNELVNIIYLTLSI